MPYLVAFGVGAVYFGLVLGLSLKFKFKLIHGLWLPTALNAFFIVMLLTAGQQDPTGWVALGYFVSLVLGSTVFVTYLILWSFWSAYLHFKASR